MGQVVRALEELARWGPLRSSALYRTEPLGDLRQPWYVNAVAELVTGAEPEALLARLKAFERRAGRDPGGVRWAPRVLDLDLLLLGDLVLDSPELTLPHPGLRTRRFVLEPLAELSPRLRDPRDGSSLSERLRTLDDPLRVEKLQRANAPGTGASRDSSAAGARGPGLPEVQQR